MKQKTLQILRYLTLPCLFSCLSLTAEELEVESDTKSTQQPIEMTFSQTYDMVETKGVTPYAGPAVEGGIDAYASASYILWHASEGGLQYAYNGFESPSLPTRAAVLPTSDFSQPEGRSIAPQFTTSSGFKAGLGLDFSYDGWVVGLNYTWLHTHATSSAYRGDVSGGLLPIHNEGFIAQTSLVNVEASQLDFGFTTTNAIQFKFPGLTSASSSWRLNFNALDLELGRNFFISSKLLMRPHYGLKGTWQKQNNITTYEADGSYNTISHTGYTVANTTSGNGVFNDKLITFTPATTGTLGVQFIEEIYQVYSHQSYWGVGPRAGMDLTWLVTKSFSVFTDVEVSLLWGQFKSTRRDVINVSHALTGDVMFENYSPMALRSRIHQVNAVVEAQIGLRYDYWFSDDEYRFRAEVGWENQLWFSQNQLLYHPDDNNFGDLSLQGFTLTFQFDF